MSLTTQQSVAIRLRLKQQPIMKAVGGGSINQTYHLQSGGKNWFCKVNSSAAFPGLFAKEANGLNSIRSQNIIAVPEVVDCFATAGKQVLILEWIKEGSRTKAFWQAFGEQLATLHRVTADRFGFAEDNYMGSVPQLNTWQKTWIDFFTHQRLMPMVERCVSKQQLTANHQALFEKLYHRLPELFFVEPPSLVHGDLWSGNFMCNTDGQPVLIDPAVYYGHRSVDLAMTTLFGGFDAAFYEAYQHNSPLPDNYKEQWTVANLYPLLIHLYLFGSSYLPQIERTILQFT